MTGYTVHTGSNDKFREGWDSIFSKPKSKQKKKQSKPKTTAKKSNKKSKK